MKQVPKSLHLTLLSEFLGYTMSKNHSTPRDLLKKHKNVCPHKDLHMMFIATAAFVSAPNWKQHKCVNKI